MGVQSMYIFTQASHGQNIYSYYIFPSNIYRKHYTHQYNTTTTTNNDNNTVFIQVDKPQPQQQLPRRTAQTGMQAITTRPSTGKCCHKWCKAVSASHVNRNPAVALADT